MSATAPLSSSLFMLERELPSYLSTAYSLRFNEEDTNQTLFQRIATIVDRTLLLLKEIIFYQPQMSHFADNTAKLNADFQKRNERIKDNSKPICVYFVGTHDHNGAILGDQFYYYHHYKIKNLEPYYTVAPKVVQSAQEMYAFLRELKAQYPAREIKVVDIVAHGSKEMICLRKNDDSPVGEHLHSSKLEQDEFKDCAKDAVIILDACSTGQGTHNIAHELAKKNPGKTVMAPGHPLYFSKPNIVTTAEGPSIDHVTHGFAIINAYTCKKYQYLRPLEPSPVPRTPIKYVRQDFETILYNPFLSTSELDFAVNPDSKEQNSEVLSTYDKLSPETQAQIKYEIWKNHNKPMGSEDFGGEFLRKNPQHPTVRSAFKIVMAHLEKELEGDPSIGVLKTAVNVGLLIGKLAGCFIDCHNVLSHYVISPLKDLFKRLPIQDQATIVVGIKA